ncbi:hypothetical protein [Oceanivirga salmonicida]|uniref:hypothetical protein n=1 Tax=Oceanivirga salmonicida TaxID=1769291 RepID=UPI0012E1F452|nr:hypothetical protein [Oceanivirga salmonicida]
MKKYKKVLILIFLATQISLAKKGFKTEISMGVESSLGVDNINSIIEHIPPILKLTSSKKHPDYEKINNNPSPNPAPSPSPGSSNLYQPILNPTKRDLFLVAKHLGKKVKFYKTLDVKISEDYFGLSAYFQSRASVRDNDEINRLKLGINSNNKYLSGYIYSYVRGETDKKYGLDKFDTEEIENKVVNYGFSLNPLPDSVASVSFDVKGKDKYVHLGPTLRIQKDGFFLNLGYSRIYNEDTKKIYVKDEILNLSATAPGYNKIEYFKKWTLKKDPDKNYNYETDKADLEKAEVSGYKGTSRILGLYSGSLYGDFPIKYALQTTDKILSSNPKYGILKEGIDYITGHNLLPNLSLITRLGNAKLDNLANDLVKDIVTDMYERVGFDPDSNYSSIGIWNQIPDDFINLLPRRNKPFNIKDFTSSGLSPNALFYDGLTKAQMLGETTTPLNRKPNSSNSGSSSGSGSGGTRIVDLSGKYEKIDKKHSVGSDAKKYIAEELFETHKKAIDILKQLSKGENIVGNGLAIVGGGLNSLRDNLYSNPYEMNGIDMLRGIYLHRSEKDKNKFETHKVLKELVKDIENLPATKMGKELFTLETGYRNKNLLIKFFANSNEKLYIKNNKYEYSKTKNKLGLNLNVHNDIVIFNSNTELVKSFNTFKKQNTLLEYSMYDIKTDNYLGFNISAPHNVNVELGLGHIGEFGYIKNPKLIINGKEYKKNVAIRDKDNNPIGKDGKSINVIKTTEKVLIDKEVANGNTNDKRNINASDYIKTEEKAAQSSWYNIYNIIYPKIAVTARPSDNLILTHEIKIPISMVNNKFDGFNAIYTGKATYLLDSHDIFYSLFDDRHLFKFDSTGDIKFSTKADELFKYNALFDFGVAKLDLKGKNGINPKNNKIDFDFIVRPLVFNFKVNPQIAIAKEDKDYTLKLGVVNKGKNIFNIGGRTVLKTKNDYFEDHIKKSILYVLKNRKESEYNHIKQILTDDYKFDSNNLKYKFTPYIEAKKDKGKLTYSFKGTSTIANANETTIKTSDTVEDKNFTIEKPLEDYAKNYIYWSYTKTKDAPNEYIYISKVNKYKDTVTKSVVSNKKVKLREFDLKLEVNYGKKTGLKISSNSNLNHKDIRVTIYNNVKTDTKRTTHESIHAIKAGNGYKVSNSWELDSNNIPGEVIKTFKEKLKPGYYYCTSGTCFSYDYESNVKNNAKLTLNSPKITNISKNSVKKATLSVKETTFNTENYLGYGLKGNKKTIINLGIGHILNIKHTSIGNVIIGDTKLFASSKWDIKHIIEPQITLNYNITKNFDLNATVGAPIKFLWNNVKNSKLIDLHLDLKYKW